MTDDKARWPATEESLELARELSNYLDRICEERGCVADDRVMALALIARAGGVGLAAQLLGCG